MPRLQSKNPRTAERLIDMARTFASARKSRGLTQKSAAAGLGVSLAHVKAIEAGTRGPSAALCDRIGEAWGLALEAECPHCGRPWGPHHR